MPKTAIIKTESKYKSETFIKRIDSTVYHVNIHFNGTNNETVRDKITHLIQMETENRKVVGH